MPRQNMAGTFSTVNKLRSGLSLSGTDSRSKKGEHFKISHESMLPAATHRPKHGSEASNWGFYFDRSISDFVFRVHFLNLTMAGHASTTFVDRISVNKAA
ncbi:hypothetical protein OIU78_008941 [Salix suchowensis]|nr:hypothetical protein OIU78_008941 [Salix suchowensis]